MAKLTNSPNEQTVIELEARKSFSFSVAFATPAGKPVDLSSSAVTFTLGAEGTYDAPPTVLLERAATIPDPPTGTGLIALQADELDLDPGEYPFVVVLRTQGYSMVAVKGVVRVEENVEFASTAHDYAPALPSTGLLVQVAGTQVVRVVLDYAPQAGGDGGLPATGVADGLVPTAQGDGTWEWEAIPLPGPGTITDPMIVSMDAAKLTGTMSPSRLVDWSLQRQKMTRETPDNLLPNGMFETGNKGYPWTQDPRFTWTTADRPPVGNTSPGAIVTQAGLGTNTVYDQNHFAAGFMVEQDVAYDFEMWIKADKPNSRIYIEVRDDNGVQAMNWTAIEGGAGASSYPVSNWLVPTTWTRVVSRGVPTPNPTTKRSWARLGSWYLNHANGTERNASYTIGGIRIRRALLPATSPKFEGTLSGANATLTGTLTTPNVMADDVHANFELTTGPASSLLSMAYGTISVTENGTPAPVYMPTGIEGLPTPTAADQAATKGYVDAGNAEPPWLTTNFSWFGSWGPLSSTQDKLRYKVFPKLGLVYTAPFLASPTTNLTNLTTGVRIAMVTNAPFDVIAPPERRGNYVACYHTGTGGIGLAMLSIQAVGADHSLSLMFMGGAAALTTTQYVAVPGLWWPMS